MKKINRNVLKIIAIVAMTMDHIAPILFNDLPIIFNIFRIIGRITFPIMAYLLADGFRYTHNLKKYIFRMFIFSIVSLFTFSFLETGSFLPIQLLDGNITTYPYNFIYISSIDKTLCISKFSVITNLLLALLTLTLWEKSKFKLPIKILFTVLMLAISLNCDWYMMPILLTLIFYYCKNKKLLKWGLYSLASLTYIFNILIVSNIFDLSLYFNVKFCLYRVGMVLVPIIIELFYNGEAGKKSKFNQYFFYIYYPAHQVLLGILALFI